MRDGRGATGRWCFRFALTLGAILLGVLLVGPGLALESLSLPASGDAASATKGSHETILPFLTLPQGPPGWRIECVVCGHGFDQLSPRAAADGAGTVHVAYGGRQLYHAWQEEYGPWQVEVVDPAYDMVLGATLALDGAGDPHILYWDSGNQALKYAWYNGVNWVREVVPSGPPLPAAVHAQAEIALDSLGQAHVTLDVDGTLFYGLRAASGWRWEEVGDNAVWASSSSIAVDQLGQPHIAYTSDGKLAYATFDGVDWITHIFAEPGAYSSIAVDGGGQVHIVARSGQASDEDDGFYYFFQDDGAWQVELIIADNGTPDDCDYDCDLYGYFPSLLLDSNDNPHVAFGVYSAGGWPYQVRRETRVSHAWRTAAGWERNGIVADQVRGASLVLKPGDVAQVLYIEDGELGSAQPGDTSGAHKTIDFNSDAGGSFVLLEVDRQGSPHALYTDSGNNELWYAAKDGGAWAQEPIASDDSWSNTYSLALGPDDRPRVAYVQGSCSRFSCYSYLKLMTKTDKGWEEKTGVNGVASKPVALTVDGSGTAHMSVERGGIDYVREIEASLEGEKVDASGVGPTAIAVDALDRPHIIYRRDGFLIHATKEGDTWVKRTIEWGPDDPLLALGVDAAGLLRLAYVKPAPTYAHPELRLATFDGTAWQKQVILAGAQQWFSPSLAFDDAGGVHLIYYQEGGRLHYVYNGGDGWEVRLLFDDGGQDNSDVAARHSHGAAITFYDAFRGALKILIMDPG